MDEFAGKCRAFCGGLYHICAFLDLIAAPILLIVGIVFGIIAKSFLIFVYFLSGAVGSALAMVTSFAFYDVFTNDSLSLLWIRQDVSRLKKAVFPEPAQPQPSTNADAPESANSEQPVHRPIKVGDTVKGFGDQTGEVISIDLANNAIIRWSDATIEVIPVDNLNVISPK